MSNVPSSAFPTPAAPAQGGKSAARSSRPSRTKPHGTPELPMPSAGQTSSHMSSHPGAIDRATNENALDDIKANAVALKQLISTYLKPADVANVEAAFEVARAAHEGQTRKSGEPYITHPLAVATILAQWHLDAQALIAAILHDVVEDTPTTKDDIAKQFGKAVAELLMAYQSSTNFSLRRWKKHKPRTSEKCCWRWRGMFA